MEWYNKRENLAQQISVNTKCQFGIGYIMRLSNLSGGHFTHNRINNGLLVVHSIMSSKTHWNLNVNQEQSCAAMDVVLDEATPSLPNSAGAVDSDGGQLRDLAEAKQKGQLGKLVEQATKYQKMKRAKNQRGKKRQKRQRVIAKAEKSAKAETSAEARAEET